MVDQDQDCSSLMPRFPMEDATVDNGCMWFVPASHQRGLLPHKPVKYSSFSVEFIDHDEKAKFQFLILNIFLLRFGQAIM